MYTCVQPKVQGLEPHGQMFSWMMPHFLFELPSKPQFLVVESEADIAVILPVRVATSLERGHGRPCIPLGNEQIRASSISTKSVGGML